MKTSELEKMIDSHGGYLEMKGFGATRDVYLFGRHLTKDKSLTLANHSPDGFNWGYNGSGPSQLALAILLEILPEHEALKHYMVFRQAVIAQLPDAGFNVRIDFKKWYNMVLFTNQPFCHAYELIDFKVRDHYFSKFMDLPNIYCGSAVFEKGTKEFELFVQMTQDERNEYREYLESRTKQKLVKTDDTSPEFSVAEINLNYEATVITITNLLGDANTVYTGNLLSLWD